MYDYITVWSGSRFLLWIDKDSYTNCAKVPSKAINHSKVLILIISHADNYERRQIIRKSWASKHNLENFSQGTHFVVLFIIGKDRKTIKSDLRNERKKFGDVIQADVTETYRNLTLKVQMAFDFAVHECRNFDYFIKTDDDVYLNMDKVAYLFSTLKKAEKIMGGSSRHHVKPDRRKDSKFYLNEADYPEIFEPDFCVGAFYFMSLDVAEIIHKLVYWFG